VLLNITAGADGSRAAQVLPVCTRASTAISKTVFACQSLDLGNTLHDDVIRD